MRRDLIGSNRQNPTFSEAELTGVFWSTDVTVNRSQEPHLSQIRLSESDGFLRAWLINLMVSASSLVYYWADAGMWF